MILKTMGQWLVVLLITLSNIATSLGAAIATSLGAVYLLSAGIEGITHLHSSEVGITVIRIAFVFLFTAIWSFLTVFFYTGMFSFLAKKFPNTLPSVIFKQFKDG